MSSNAQQQQPPPSGLYHFLLGFRVERGSDHTHTSFSRPAGAFYIPSAEHDRFIKLYKTALQRREDVHLTEHHRHIGPLIVDLDFRYEPQPGDLQAAAAGAAPRRRHTDEVVKEVARIYSRQLAEFVEVPPQFDVIITEKSSATMHKGLVKDGLHLVVPGVVTRPGLQLLMRHAALPQLSQALAPLGLANRIDDVVDEAVIERNNWMMYGSKKPHGEAYKVTRRFVYDSASGEVHEAPPLLEGADVDGYVELLSIRNKYDETPVRPERTDMVSSFFTQRDEQRKRREAVQAYVSITPNARQNTLQGDPSELDYIRQLVEVLAPTRAAGYNDWMRVGWCLRNIDHRLCDAWVKFSKSASDKYAEGECERLWQLMKMGTLTVRSLHRWAKHDNPEAYERICASNRTPLIERAARTCAHHDVARVVHHMFGNEFVCSSVRNKRWWEFKGHRWHESDCAHSLRRELSERVWKEFMKAINVESARALTVDANQDNIQETIKRLNIIATKLRTTKFKDDVMRECTELFYVEHFEDLLDSNCDLVGFDNGVYDLERDEFRDGRPEDHVSFSTGIEYIPYDEHHPVAVEIRRYWEQVHPNKDVREYVMRSLSSCLSGHIKAERFNIWTGSGCHAKGAPIMMLDGDTKPVEDVAVGDLLMGDDSTPRRVLQLFRGHADMYQIVPAKGEAFVVNGDHVLSLKTTHSVTVSPRKPDAGGRTWRLTWLQWDAERLAVNRGRMFVTREEADEAAAVLSNDPSVVKSGDVVDVTVKKYLANARRVGERYFNLYRPQVVDFPARPLTHPALHPYVLGMWLGDGTAGCNQLAEGVRELLPPTVSRADAVGNKRSENDVAAALESYGLVGNKHIPLDYRCNTREVRLQLLAGLLDTDGTYRKHTNQLTLTLTAERVIDDTVALARSLGFACYKRQTQSECCNNGKVGTCYSINIVGPGVEHIPLRLAHKRPRERIKVKDVRRVGFKIERVEDGDFYGFELDGNHRYLAGDYIVFHNSNSKSLSVNLLEKSFGDYCVKFPVTLLTQKRAASNAATTEIARAKGKRFGVLQEPSEDERLNIGLMKEMTGGDKIFARPLYREPIEFKPQFKMFLLCNHLPNVPSDDGGTWRRIRVVEFGSRFCDKPDPDKPNEFPIDSELPKRIDSWKEHFMALLIHVYSTTNNKRLDEPEEVLRCTREYQRNNDHMADFVDSCLERVPVPGGGAAGGMALSIDDVYDEFKDWVRRDSIPIRTPKKRDLLNYIDKNVEKAVHVAGVRSVCWRGLRLRLGQDAGDALEA